ncbi:MAG: hypothetical protein OXG30_05485, partial [bacterium]|nr:hypothetical protein [bacterium]
MLGVLLVLGLLAGLLVLLPVSAGAQGSGSVALSFASGVSAQGPEGDSGSVEVEVEVRATSVSAPSLFRLCVDDAGTADLGSDWRLFSGSTPTVLTSGCAEVLLNGSQVLAYKLVVVGDAVVESDETIRVRIEKVAGQGPATVAAGKGSLAYTIVNDDYFVNSDGDVVVPADWALVPDGLDAGDRFRLLFRTTARRDATATDIGVYDSFVQGEVRSGALAALLGPYVSAFKAVGSTSSVDARDHLGLWESGAYADATSANADAGVGIYWMDAAGKGALVANGYADFCVRDDSGSNPEPEVWWKNDLLTDQRDEDGAAHGDDNWPWTGTTNSCTKKQSPGALGQAGPVERGAHRVTATSGRFYGPLSNQTQARTASNSLYGMSPAFTVAPVGAEVYVSLAPNQTIFAVEGGSAQTDVFSVGLSRGLAAGEMVRAVLAPVEDVTLSLSGSPSGVSFDAASGLVTFVGGSGAAEKVLFDAAAAANTLPSDKSAVSRAVALSAVQGVGPSEVSGDVGASRAVRMLIKDSGGTVVPVEVSVTAAVAEGGTATAVFALGAVRTSATVVQFYVVHGGGDVGTLTSSAALSGSGDGPYTVTIPANTASVSVSIPITDDTVPEGDEALYVTLGDLPKGLTINQGGDAGFAKSVIGHSELSLSARFEPASAPEGDSGTAEYKLVVGMEGSHAASTNVTLTLGGTATYGADYDVTYAGFAVTPTNGSFTVQILLGKRSTEGFFATRLRLRVKGDTTAEGPETVTAAVATTAAGIGGGSGSFTIVDDDLSVSFGQATYSAVEGDPVQVTVVLSQARSVDTPVALLATGSTATGSGTDFTSGSFTVTIPAGETEATVDIPTVADNVAEGAEQFGISIVGHMLPAGVALGPQRTANATIYEASVSLSAAAFEAAEGSPAEIGVVLSRAIGAAAMITVQAQKGSSGTADSPADFTAGNRSVTIPAGQTRGTVSVPTAADNVADDGEVFEVILAIGSLPNGLVAGPRTTATVTITETVVVGFAQAAPDAAAAEGATATATVSLSSAAPTAFALEFLLSGSAEPFGDFWVRSARGLVGRGRVLVPVGASSVDVPVWVSDDAEPEGAESVVLTLVDPGVADVELDPEKSVHTVTIQASDGDGPVGDAVSAGWDYGGLEGGRRTAWLESSELVLPVSVSPAAKADFRVAVTLEPEAAAGLWAPSLGPGGDIYEARHTAVVKAGASSARFFVPMIDDNVVEDDWVWVAALEVSGAALGAEAVSARRELEVVVRDDDQAEVLFERRGGPGGNIWVVLSRPVRFDLNVRVLTRSGLASPDVDFGAYRTETGGLLTAVDTGVSSLSDIRFVHVGVASSDRPAWLFSGHPCIVGTSLSGPPPADPPACGDYRLHEHHRVDISRPRGVVPTVRLAPAPA